MTKWKIDLPPNDGSSCIRLVLVRHGQTSWNASGLIQGHQGPGLNTTGTLQAQEVAQQLLQHFPQPDLVVSSDLQRCVETAEPYASRLRLPLNTDARLREIDNGEWSGQPTKQIAIDHADTIERIRHGEDIARGGGETTIQLRQRARKFTDDLRGQAAQHNTGNDFTAVAFSHGGTIRALFAEALGVPQGLQLFGPVDNCSISVLELYGHDAAVVSHYNHHRAFPSAHESQDNRCAIHLPQ